MPQSIAKGSKRKWAVCFIALFFIVAGVAAGAIYYFSKNQTVAATPQSNPAQQPWIESDIPVPMDDGTPLMTDVFHPVGKGPFPVILSRSPYGKKEMALLVFIANAMAKRGFVFVMQNCRGRFNSPGEFVPFRNEIADSRATLDWVLAQKWCNKKVGTVGFSYLGYTGWTTAVSRPGQVSAVVGITTGSSPYQMVYNDGVFKYITAIDWALTVDGKENQSLPDQDWNIPIPGPMVEVDDKVRHNLPYFDNWATHPSRDDYWREVDIADQIPNAGAPALVVGGWYDIFLKDALDDFVALNEKGLGDAKKSCLIMGPWAHDLLRKVGPVDFGPKTGFIVIAKALHDWFEDMLKKGVPRNPKVSIFVMGKNKWRNETTWPLSRTRYKKIYLHSKGKANTLKGDGTLSWEPPVMQPQDRFTFDPKMPVPTMGGCIYPAGYAGPRDQQSIEQREDVLVYTSPPLSAPMEITGPIKAVIYAGTSAADTDFTAKLVAVKPTGEAIILQDGITRMRRNPSAKGVKAGEIVRYDIDLWATSYWFDKGEQIRVEVSSSNFPRFEVNRNTGNDEAVDTEFITAKQQVAHDKDYPSHIVLPVIPQSD